MKVTSACKWRKWGQICSFSLSCIIRNLPISSEWSVSTWYALYKTHHQILFQWPSQTPVLVINHVFWHLRGPLEEENPTRFDDFGYFCLTLMKGPNTIIFQKVSGTCPFLSYHIKIRKRVLFSRGNCFHLCDISKQRSSSNTKVYFHV